MEPTNIEAFLEHCVSSELIYDGKVVHLYVDRIKLPNGAPSTREYCRHIGAVAVLPLTDDGEVICVRQYLYAHGCMMTEIPAGKLEYGEDPADAEELPPPCRFCPMDSNSATDSCPSPFVSA